LFSGGVGERLRVVTWAGRGPGVHWSRPATCGTHVSRRMSASWARSLTCRCKTNRPRWRRFCRFCGFVAGRSFSVFHVHLSTSFCKYACGVVMYKRRCPSLTFIMVLDSSMSAVQDADVTISAGFRKRRRVDLRTFLRGRKRACRPWYWSRRSESAGGFSGSTRRNALVIVSQMCFDEELVNSRSRTRPLLARRWNTSPAGPQALGDNQSCASSAHASIDSVVHAVDADDWNETFGAVLGPVHSAGL
jgi:hypothetical protein